GCGGIGDVSGGRSRNPAASAQIVRLEDAPLNSLARAPSSFKPRQWDVMPKKSSDTDRASSHPTELERAIRACRSGFAVCAMFSLAINVLMLTLPVYMLQVYDRVLTTGRVETLVMLTLIATIAL